jgi:hypothetical protein
MADNVLPGGGPVLCQPKEGTSPERTEAENILRRIPGVEGVGEGRDALGNPAWIAYVKDNAVLSQVPGSVSGRTVVPEVSGEIDILPAE